MKTWTLRIVSFGLVSLLTLALALLQPNLLYANKTQIGNYTIFHQTELAPEFESRLANIHAIIQESELFEPNFSVKICLNDGSYYPKLMQKLRAPAFGWGFHNITTYNGQFDYSENTVELNGYKWNMEQLMAHEITHSLQFQALGLLNANPIGNHPDWKWEGYAEYVSRKSTHQWTLPKSIERILAHKKEHPNTWGITLEDQTVSPVNYYEHWLLVRYCLEVKSMTYLELLASGTSQNILKKEMLDWYKKRSS